MTDESLNENRASSRIGPINTTPTATTRSIAKEFDHR
jgi:hypothetical protein